MKCQHALFDVTRHDYCPTCSETNFDKILDERYIVGLSAETARLLKENERLKAWKDQARYWENQSDDLRKENIWLKEEIEDKESALDKMRAIIGERETLLWQCRENNERLQKDAERMQKENERLQSLVKSAYHDGWTDGSSSGLWGNSDNDWARSDTRKALAPTEDKP